jgi:aspartate aminotransferase
MRLAFDARRKYMLARLQAIPDLWCPTPVGAFYTFPQVSAFYGRTFDGVAIDGSMGFCTALLEHAKLALVPGGAFGNDAHVRLSYATSMEEIEKAMDRLEWFLGKLE